MGLFRAIFYYFWLHKRILLSAILFLGFSASSIWSLLQHSEDPRTLFAYGAKCYNEQDFPEAVKWFQKAAKKGHAEAQNALGTCY